MHFKYASPRFDSPISSQMSSYGDEFRKPFKENLKVEIWDKQYTLRNLRTIYVQGFSLLSTSINPSPYSVDVITR